MFRTTLKSKYNNKLIGYHQPIPETKPGSMVFIHVPRTGGTSINQYMKEYHKTNSHRLLYTEPHFIPDFNLPINSFSYYTVIRHPVERALSYYQLQLKDKLQPYRHLIKAGDAVFVSKCWEVDNIYVRYFSNTVEKKVVDKHDMLKAYKTLLNFEKCIPFEDISQFFTTEFPVDTVTFPHLNKSVSTKNSNTLRKLLEERNFLDLELYNMLMKEHT